MVQQTAGVEKTQKQRADELAVCAVTKAADDAIGRAHPLVFLHAGALARLIGKVDAFCHDAIEAGSQHLEPRVRLVARTHNRRQAKRWNTIELARRKAFERNAALRERRIDQ